MNSHEYAQQLRALADKLEQAKPFPMPDYQANYHRDYGMVNLSYHNEKDSFLEAVRSAGNGKKNTDDHTFQFVCFDGLVRLTVYRDAVCRLIKPAQPAQYDCEPLLSQEEESSLGGVA